MRRTVLTIFVVAGLIWTTPLSVPAHEIPADVTVQVIVKPDGDRLHLLVRAPLRAMRDMQFPLRGPGYLELGMADEHLRNAAVLWIANEIDLFEADRRLVEYELVAARASIPSDKSFGGYLALDCRSPPTCIGKMRYSISS